MRGGYWNTASRWVVGVYTLGSVGGVGGCGERGVWEYNSYIIQGGLRGCAGGVCRRVVGRRVSAHSSVSSMGCSSSVRS